MGLIKRIKFKLDSKESMLEDEISAMGPGKVEG